MAKPTKAELYEDLRSIAAERDRYREQASENAKAAKTEQLLCFSALVALLNSPDVKALAKGPNFELGPADPFTRRAIRNGWKVVRGEQ